MNNSSFENRVKELEAKLTDADREIAYLTTEVYYYRETVDRFLKDLYQWRTDDATTLKKL